MTDKGIERVLGLPGGTINKWKNLPDEMEPEEVVLQKILKMYPWMLKVVDNNYDVEIAKGFMIEEAWSKVFLYMNEFVEC